MPDAALEDLYREILLDHYRNPRHHTADGANPLCGDQITIEATVNADGRIEDIAFSGAGCSISQASSSMMTVYVAGHTTAEALRAVETFQQMMLTGEAPSTAEQDLGDIEALAGVAKFPVRVKCASLAWKTLQQALQSQTAAAVTTDERSE